MRMIHIPRQRVFWASSIGHFTNDVFMAMGVVILTFLSASILPMTNAQIGFAVSMKQLLGAVTQPFFGWRADRTGGRGLGAGGLAWVVLTFTLSIMLAVTTRNYWVMLVPFVLQGIGSGAVHPVGSLHSAEVDPERRATNVSYFFLMGQIGLALGPALIGYLLDVAHQGTLLPYGVLPGFPAPQLLEANVFPIYLIALAALPSVAFMWLGIPSLGRASVEAGDVSAPKKGRKGARIWWPFVVIGVMVVLRGLATPGSVNFIPALFQAKGWSPAAYGLITSSFWIASGISGVVFGSLADRFDRRLVVMSTMVLAAPAFFLLPVLDGPAAFALAIIAGGFVGGAHSIIVVLAQEMVPDSKGMASGMILGFIFGTGALGSLAIGIVADLIGLGVTFQIVAVAVALAGLVSLLLPPSEPRPVDKEA